MKTTKTLLILAFLGGCAGGDGDDDDGIGESGSIGTDDTGTSTGGMTATTSSTTAAPTTASTLTGTTTVDDTTTDDPTADTGTETGGAADCSAYCDTYLSACADHSEYANAQDCMDNCAQWPIGEATDTDVDSVGCRLYHATVAGSTDPDMHCPHAGPSGGGVCIAADAPTCDLYCTRYFSNCTEDLNAFVDMANCLDECSEWYPGAEADVAGHTVGCHSYHANAAVGGPEEHCPHAGPGGGGICVL